MPAGDCFGADGSRGLPRPAPQRQALVGDHAGIAAGPAYRIHTPRLVLRCWQPTDARLLKTAVDASLDHRRTWMSWAQDEPTDLPAKVERWRREP